MRSFPVIAFLIISLPLFAGVSTEKECLAVMDVQDKDNLFTQRTRDRITDYIFVKLQGTEIYWMVPKSDRDSALEQAIEETKQGSRKKSVNEKDQISLVAELQANYLINTEIVQLVKGLCQISIKKFNVEKKVGTEAWDKKFNCTEAGVYDVVDDLIFAVKKRVCGLSISEQGIDMIEDFSSGTCQDKVVKTKKKHFKKVTDAVKKPVAGKWSKKSTVKMNWDDAKKYCEDLKEGKYSNWRLPTISELRTLIKNCPATETGGACKVTSECLHHSNCGNDDCSGCVPAHGRYSRFGDTEVLWSSSERAGIRGVVWHVSFSNGFVGSLEKSESSHVRCFR